jgi:CRISPR-associated protein Csx10
MWQLQIELKSRLCSGSGRGSAGFADRDVVFDEFGLPFIPGKRLKGLLRESLWEIYSSGAFNDTSSPDDLFGLPGAGESAPIDIGDANLTDAEGLRAWLRAQPPQINPADVLESYTEIVRQTAINPSTGSPSEDTLRATRVLRPRLKFAAPVYCSDAAIAARSRTSLERAAEGLQFMGIARTRGWGWVRCSLRADEHAQEPVLRVNHAALPGEAVLSFEVLLGRNALCPVRASDPNTVSSEEFLPGSAIHGMLARRHLNSGTADEAFFRRFFSGSIRFMNAFPVVGERRGIPVPHSVREKKHQAGDFVELAAEDPEEPLRRVRGWIDPEPFGLGRETVRTEVQTVLHYHHSRADDLRIGRAVGDRHQDYDLRPDSSGQVFTYQSIEKGQRFAGLIAGPAAELDEIRRLVGDSESGVRLGRSKNSQYGAAGTWSWGSIRHLTKTGRVEFAASHVAPEANLADQIVVTLLSDLIGVNENGHPVAVFPSKELGNELNPGLDLVPNRSFARTGWCGGYLAHQGLPRQQMPCLRAGSVFVFRLSEPISWEVLDRRLVAAERKSYGFRTEEGFGRIGLSAVSHPAFLKNVAQTAYNGNVLVRDTPQYQLALGVFRKRLAERASLEGRKLALAIGDGDLTSLSSHLLNRLLAIVDRQDLGEAIAKLDSLRPSVTNRLKRVWITGDAGEKGFLQELTHCVASPPSIAEGIVRHVFAQARSGWPRLFGPNPPALTAVEQTNLARRRVKSLLKTLLWRKRGMAERGRGEND